MWVNTWLQRSHIPKRKISWDTAEQNLHSRPQKGLFLPDQALYARLCAGRGSYHEPTRRWWEPRQFGSASRAERAELAALEAALSLEEAAHFRAGVAVQHSRHLGASGAVLQHAMDFVDVVVGTPLALPAPVEGMLFQRGSSGGGRRLLQASLRADCPKLGAQLCVGEEWAALTPRVPATPFKVLEAAVRHTALAVPPAGDACVSCASIAVGGLGALDEPLPALVLQSPSQHCNRLLAVADLHAAATRSQLGGDQRPRAPAFLRVTLGRAREQQRSPWAASDEWSMRQPCGLQVDIEAAGIEVGPWTVHRCIQPLLDFLPCLC